MELKFDGADPEESTLLLNYNSSFSEADGYLRPAVKIEMGARSDTWPSDEIFIQTMLSEGLPDVVEKENIQVLTLSPRRTFWEKATLLHDEYFRPDDKQRKVRMARHYYDLWCLIVAGVAEEALKDTGLFESVIDHRMVFFRQNWVDYETMKKSSLRILPREELDALWKQDYEAMSSFFFPDEQPPKCEAIVEVVGDFEKQFNK